MRHQVVMFAFLSDSSVFKHYDFITIFEVLQLMGDEQDSFFSQFLFDAFEEYVFSNMSVNGGERIVQKNYISITVHGPAMKNYPKCRKTFFLYFGWKGPKIFLSPSLKFIHKTLFVLYAQRGIPYLQEDKKRFSKKLLSNTEYPSGS